MFFSVLLILLLSVCCSAFVSFFRPVDPFLVLSRLFMLYTLCFFSAVDVGVCLYVISFYVLCVCFLFVVLQFPLTCSSFSSHDHSSQVPAGCSCSLCHYLVFFLCSPYCLSFYHILKYFVLGMCYVFSRLFPSLFTTQSSF